MNDKTPPPFDDALLKSLAQRVDDHRADLINRCQQVLHETLLTNRSEMRSDELAHIATAEADALIYSLRNSLSFVKEHGAALCEMGLSRQTVFGLLRAIWEFLIAHFENDFVALNIYTSYYIMALDGFLESNEKRILSEQEGVRNAFQIALDNSTAKISESEERHLSLVELSPDMVALLDLNGNLIMVNKAGAELFKYETTEEMIGKNMLAVIAPANHALILDTFQKILETRGGRNIEVTAIRKDGTTFNAAFNGSMIFDANGKAEAVMIVSRDITLQKQIEQLLKEKVAQATSELQRANERLNELLTHSPAILYAAGIGEGYPTTFISGNVLEQLGYLLEQFLSNPDFIFSHVHPQDEERVRFETDHIFENEQMVLEYRIRCQNGEYRWIRDSLCLIRSPEGQPLKIIGSWVDITERKQVEETLRESEARYRAIVEDQTELICRFHLDRKITFVNDAYCMCFGIKRDEIIGRSFMPLIPMEDQDIVSKNISGLSPENPAAICEHRVILPNGELRWQQWVNHAIYDEMGQVREIQSVGRDITARKSAEETIKRRNEELLLLNTINQAVNRGDSLESIIRLIAKETTRIFNGLGITTHLLSPNRQRLVMQDSFIPSALVDGIEKLIGIPIPRIEHDLQAAHPYRQVMESGKSQVINGSKGIQEIMAAYLASVPVKDKLRARLKRLIPAIVKLLGYQSVLIVPLISEEGVIGILDMGRREPFTEDDAKWLEAIAGQLSSIIIHKQAEKKLRDVEEFQSILLNATESTTIALFDRAGTILTMNEFGAQLIGKRQDELIGLSVHDVFSKEIADARKAHIDEICRTSATVHFEDFRQGIWFENSLYPILDSTGRVAQIAVYARDISERKRNEQLLHASEQRYRALAEASHDMIFVIDRDDKITYVNNYASMQLGVQPDALIGQARSRWFGQFDAEKMGKGLKQVIKTGESQYAETEIGFPRGKVSLSTWLVPLKDQNGVTDKVLGVSRDISELKKLENSLKETNLQLEAKVGKRTAELRDSRDHLQKLTQQIIVTQEEERRRISRELHDEAGQALIGLRFSLDSIRKELPANPRELRQRMAKALTLTDQTIKRIRTLAYDLRPPTLELVGINLGIKGLCQEFSDQTGLKVEYSGIDLEGLHDEISISLYRFVQEALTNVAKHSRASKVQVTLEYQDEMIKASVLDNGRGIPAKSKKSGLGLMGMKERFDILGGWLEVKPVISKGSLIQACVPWKDIVKM